jgi:hypothetical protein
MVRLIQDKLTSALMPWSCLPRPHSWGRSSVLPPLPPGVPVAQRQFRCRGVQPFVQGPKSAPGNQRRREQMHIYPPESPSPKSADIHQMKHVCIGGAMSRGKRAQVGQEREAIFQVAAREFAADKRVHVYQSVREEIGQFRLSIAKMRNPDRRIHEDHQADRRLGTSPSFGCVPPSAARRLPASREMRASRPARTSAAFSRMPVASLARSSRVSSIMMVVRICISMH